MRLTSITQRYTQILYLHSKTMEVNEGTFKKNTPAIMQTYFYYYFQTCENQINVDSVTW